MNDTVSLVDVSDAEATLRVGDTDYKLRRLEVGDYAAAQQSMIDRRMQAVIDKLRATPVDDKVLSGALADVVSRPITFQEMLSDHTTEMFLLGRALKVSGQNITPKGLPPAQRRVLTQALLWATGIPAAAMEESPAPLATTDTGLSCTPENDGTEPSAPCVSPTE